jgi:DNA repair exonuclease SbcCD ATPase subunit
MGKLIAICVALFVLAVGVIALNHGQEGAAMYAALWTKPSIAEIFRVFLTVPLPEEAAWLVALGIPFILVTSLLWFRLTHAGQRRAAQRHFREAREGAKELAKSHVDTESAVHHLARTDPEAAISAIQQRLTEAERIAQIHSARNEMPDLQSRVDYIRDQQEALKKQLAPVLERRRSIEHLFMELDSRQNDIDRALAEIASADDAVSLDLSLKNFMEFIRRSHGRCDDIERASKTMANLKQDFAGLEMRLGPYAATEGGVQNRIKDLNQARVHLTTLLDSIQKTSDGSLSEQLQSFAETNRSLGGRISELDSQFSKLGTLREGIDGLLRNMNRALDLLSIAKTSDSAGSIEARIGELRAFIENTQSRFDDIERRLVTFNQLRTGLDELKSRLAPLESERGGVVSVLGGLKELRDGLVSAIRRIEESDDGSLSERVKSFADMKRELEQRVAVLSEQCFRLATTRNEIAALLQKLSATAAAAERWSKDGDNSNGAGHRGSAILPTEDD